MSNMSYCRFSNTLSDLRECKEALDCEEELSEEEAKARTKLIKLCEKIADQYGRENREYRCVFPAL